MKTTLRIQCFRLSVWMGISLSFGQCSNPFPELDTFGLLYLTQSRHLALSCRTNCPPQSENGDSANDNNSNNDPVNDNNSNNDPVNDNNSNNEIPNLRKYIFVTQGTTTGNMGGISGADGFCANQKNTNFASLPGIGSDYKALLVDDTNRRACNSANCTSTVGNNISWILLPNTEYFRMTPTEVSLFTTNGGGIIVFGNLTNSISTSGGDRWWTGLEDDWTSTPVDRCSNWTSGSGLDQGNFGSGAVTDQTVIIQAGLASDCDTALRLLCVRN